VPEFLTTMGAQRTWTNLLFLILRQISRMGTDKTDPLKQETPVSSFDAATKSLELVIDFSPGSGFTDPDSDSGELWPVHDTVQRTWQHLNFFEHATTLRARVPRIKTVGGSCKNASFQSPSASSTAPAKHAYR
jgi:hypothetical protein